MGKLNLALLFFAIMAFANEVLAGEKIPDPRGGMLELTGSDGVTGLFALIAGLLAIFGVFMAALNTLNYWQHRSAEANKADHTEIDFANGEEASRLYAPLFQFFTGVGLIAIWTWGPSFFGFFVSYKYKDMIVFALDKIP